MRLENIQVYTPSELEERFEKVRFVGSGGEGCIYEVKEKTSGHTQALKIANNNWRVNEQNIRIATIVSTILEQQISPHLSSVYELISVRCAVFAHSACHETNGFFNGHSKYEGEGDGTFPRRAILMEILEGDLGKIYKELNELSIIALKIQCASIAVVLAQHSVVAYEADKFRNILFKTLGPNDTFKSKVLIEFEFWKYVFGKYTFYLPRPKYLIKLADYDSWSVESIEVKKDPVETLGYFLTQVGMTLKTAKKLFEKPDDSNAKILEVFNSSNNLAFLPS